MSSVINRVWDPTKGGFVSWRTEYPDEYGIEYPGPGEFSSSSDYCLERADVEVTGAASLLGGEFDPAWLILLDGDLSAISGSGVSVYAGTEQYLSGPVSGSQAHFFNGSTILTQSVYEATLAITGNITIEALIWLTSSSPTGYHDIVEFAGGPSDAGAYNSLWQMGANHLNAFYSHEYGGGVNATHIWSSALETNKWLHIVMVRDVDNNKVRLYINGTLSSEEYNYSSDPTGGTSSKASIGGFFSNNIQKWNGRVSSVKIIPRMLSHAEIMAEHKRWLNPNER